VQPVSSVTAFVARWVPGDTTDDPVVAQILSRLDDEGRLVVAAQAVPAAARADWLRERSGSAWSAARLAHAEQRVFVQLRRELQAHRLWRD
jgi:hypothetical protein